MIKKIALYLVSFSVLFAISFGAHTLISDKMELYLRIPLFSIYLFHYLVSLAICIGFSVLATTEKWSHQLGFVYLFTFITKLMLFAILFRSTLFYTENLNLVDNFNLLIPIFLFLFFEVYFISKLIGKKQY